jgi:hypothetical protein
MLMISAVNLAPTGDINNNFYVFPPFQIGNAGTSSVEFSHIYLPSAETTPTTTPTTTATTTPTTTPTSTPTTTATTTPTSTPTTTETILTTTLFHDYIPSRTRIMSWAPARVNTTTGNTLFDYGTAFFPFDLAVAPHPPMNLTRVLYFFENHFEFTQFDTIDVEFDIPFKDAIGSTPPTTVAVLGLQLFPIPISPECLQNGILCASVVHVAVEGDDLDPVRGTYHITASIPIDTAPFSGDFAIGIYVAFASGTTVVFPPAVYALINLPEDFQDYTVGTIDQSFTDMVMAYPNYELFSQALTGSGFTTYQWPVVLPNSSLLTPTAIGSTVFIRTNFINTVLRADTGILPLAVDFYIRIARPAGYIPAGFRRVFAYRVTWFTVAEQINGMQCARRTDIDCACSAVFAAFTINNTDTPHYAISGTLSCNPSLSLGTTFGIGLVQGTPYATPANYSFPPVTSTDLTLSRVTITSRFLQPTPTTGTLTSVATTTPTTTPTTQPDPVTESATSTETVSPTSTETTTFVVEVLPSLPPSASLGGAGARVGLISGVTVGVVCAGVVVGVVIFLFVKGSHASYVKL